MLDLQERGDAPEPVALVEADVRGELGFDLEAEIDGWVQRKAAKEREEAEQKRREAIAQREEAVRLFRTWFDDEVPIMMQAALNCEFDVVNGFGLVRLDYRGKRLSVEKETRFGGVDYFVVRSMISAHEVFVGDLKDMLLRLCADIRQGDNTISL